MAEEKSNLVEAVDDAAVAEESNDSNDKDESVKSDTKDDEFNPLAFVKDDTYQVDDSKEDGEETTSDSTEKTEATKETSDVKTDERMSESGSEEDGWEWNEIESESKDKHAQSQQDEDVDWELETSKDENESSKSKPIEKSIELGNVDWESVGKEFGVHASTKAELLEALTQQMEPQQSVDDGDVAQLNKFLTLSDRELMAEEMKEAGMEEFDIEESLDKLDESGQLKMNAFRIRKQIKNAIAERRESVTSSSKEDKQKQEKQVKQSRKELQKHLKSLNNFMGGRVSVDDAKKAYKYIVSGDMSKDIWSNHGNASEIALFMLFKDKFVRILKNSGVEEGKANVLNGISSPNLSTRSKSSYVPKKNGFDPGAFLKE